ncbi:hypothetical protein [Calothrix sp. NIES-3974]|uniref:hypothetical protein n=1 Tax=Calothrix sp. NIES-3974 TaxID=2005462 RepID=UPI000B5FCC92|nr:hypothetical protein [Calothrix sp. NIES-3974]BAZ05837.1 hypothetical protein NIES3974_24920 [Calothrix sp. NIES-3974]
MRVFYLLILTLPIFLWHWQQGVKMIANSSLETGKRESAIIFNLDMAARDERPADCIYSGRCRG